MSFPVDNLVVKAYFTITSPNIVGWRIAVKNIVPAVPKVWMNVFLGAGMPESNPLGGVFPDGFP